MDEEKGQPEASTTIISRKIKSSYKLRSDQLRVQSNKNQRLVQKYYGLVEVIYKIMKTSYRIQLLLWMRTNLVVHVSNLKRYYFDQEDIKQKQVVWRHANKKKFQADKVGKTRTEKTWRSQQTEKWFSTAPSRLEETHYEISWKRIERPKVSLIQ